MRFVKKHSIFLILIFFFTIVLSQANHVSQTVQLRVFLNENSFTIVVEDNQNDLGQSISLRDFGFSYEYYEESRNTKLSNYRGFEAAFDRIEPGTCIFVRVDDPNLSISLPGACVGVPIEISVHIADRFWYIPEDDDFRPITFSNSFTDQQCRIRSSACTIRFEQNAESADSGQISGADELNTEIESISTIPFGDGEDTSLVLEANGKSAIIRKADCATTAHPDDFPEHEITVFAVCDANGEEAEFFIHNPDGELIEWVVWRVLPQHLPEGTPETPSETATPDPNFDPDVITGDVSVVQSNLRDGPGTDFPPDARFPFVAEGTRIELTGQYVDLDTHQLWYQGIIDGRIIWIFANNVSVNAGNQVTIPFISFDNPPEPPQLPDEDNDGVPDIEDVCPNNPNASRRSECDDGPSASGIANNNRVSNPPTPEPVPDRDSDGILDNHDDCPNEAGIALLNGCPDSDDDGDGITNIVDDCPNEAGIALLNGCPDSDDDGDRVMNTVDDCPNEAGIASLNGCPDSDADGVPDNLDACPTVAGAGSDGCSLVALDCTLTVNVGVNVRTYPEYGNIVGGGLVAGTTMVITQKMTGAPEGNYYHVGSGWVVGYAVSLSGNCNVLSTEIYVPDSRDDDGDGINNSADNCPAVANSDQADSDNNGIGDACDGSSDTDGDGIDNATDNCPTVANADQMDTDGDGIGDACDTPPCTTVGISSANTSSVDGYLPYLPTVNFTLECPLTNGEQVWVIVHPSGDSNYGWGPASASGSLGAGLGAGENTHCGNSFELSVVIASAGSIQNSVAYPNLPGVLAQRGLGTFTKSCTWPITPVPTSAP